MDTEYFKTAKKVVGVKQTARALEKGGVKKVFVAADADKRVVQPIADACAKVGVPVESVESMQELGRLCGIQVGAATVAVLF